MWRAKYPDDDRPRLAILAAEQWAKNPNAANKQKAAYAADAAAAAAYAAAAYSAYATAAYSAYATAAYAASAYSAYATAAYAARQRSLARSAAIVRRIIPCPRLPKARTV
jgi:hypothetical protein